MTQIVATVYAQTTGAGMKSEKALSLLISLLLISMLLGTCLGEEFTSKFEVIVQSDIVFAEVDGVKLLGGLAPSERG
jgi:hypothetical protein